MGTISMQVLLTDTLYLLFFSWAGFICQVTPLFAKSSHSMYGLHWSLNALHHLSQKVPEVVCVCL